MTTKPQHGGSREGAGRPRIGEERTTRHTVTIAPEDLAYLKGLNCNNLSLAIREALRRARKTA